MDGIELVGWSNRWVDAESDSTGDLIGRGMHLWMDFTDGVMNVRRMGGWMD